jgi:mRNA interferase HigB
VRIISETRIKDFWRSRKKDSLEAEKYMAVWIKLARSVVWKDFADLKQTFGSADQFGNCTIFDVGNNRYRLIGRVNYRAGKLYVLAVMDHAEYDKERWKADCGCHLPPPPLSPPKKHADSTGKHGGAAKSPKKGTSK